MGHHVTLWTFCAVGSGSANWDIHLRPVDWFIGVSLHADGLNAGCVRSLCVVRWGLWCFDPKLPGYCHHWGGASLPSICRLLVLWVCVSSGIPFASSQWVWCIVGLCIQPHGWGPAKSELYCCLLQILPWLSLMRPSHPCHQILSRLIVLVSSSSDFNMLVGLRETASEALCHFPWLCWIVNLYHRVFSFCLNNLGFWILLMSLSPNSPFSGSWSVTTMRLRQPMMNKRHFCNVHAIAAASPSIGTYLLSASVQNLLPGNIKYHLSGQQTVAVGSTWTMNPIPSLLQSGARQVTWFFSNMAMPSRTRSTMTCLEC